MGSFSSRCLSTARLDGKTAIITGSNTGIGKETALNFFKRGARVIMACRSEEKALTAAEDIQNKCKNDSNLGEILVTHLDLSSLESIRNFAKNINSSERRIDLLINNAGIMACPYGKTTDGFELQFGTNHLGHFLLTLLLLPKVTGSSPSRIVNVSSMAHRKGTIYFDDLNFENKTYSPVRAYAQSKLANVLFTKELARRIREAGMEDVTVYSLHPGVIATDLGRHLDKTYFSGLRWTMNNLARPFIKTPEQGAQTILHCALDENAGKETGLYYEECKIAGASNKANNMDDARKLWDVSLKLVGLDKNYNPFSSY